MCSFLSFQGCFFARKSSYHGCILYILGSITVTNDTHIRMNEKLSLKKTTNTSNVMVFKAGSLARKSRNNNTCRNRLPRLPERRPHITEQYTPSLIRGIKQADCRQLAFNKMCSHSPEPVSWCRCMAHLSCSQSSLRHKAEPHAETCSDCQQRSLLISRN